MDTTDDSGYAAYQRLMAALSFAEIPHLLPQYLVRRRHRRGASHVPQTVAARDPPEGRSAERHPLAATALEQLAGLRFDRAEANMRKAAVRIHAHHGDLRHPPL